MKAHRIILGWTIVMALAGCNGAPKVEAPAGPPEARKFEDEVAFLKKHGKVEVLEAPEGGRIALSPKYQGRVMTSTVEPGGPSLGFINHDFIASGRTGTAFDNYGGEDRFWLAPEGGQNALFFKRGAAFDAANWQTPSALQEGEWTMTPKADGSILFRRFMKFTNYAGAEFHIRVDRRVRLLSMADVNKSLGLVVPTTCKFVAFETVNQITNVSKMPFARQTGLPAIWILGQFPPFAGTTVVVPFDKRAQGPIVNDAYFGKVPADRLKVDQSAGVVLFKADGLHRSKIGLGPARALPVLGSYSENEKMRLLTVVQFDKPAGRNDYVGNEWKIEDDPYAGDVLNTYNDGGSKADGKGPTVPTFYELESLSPAMRLEHEDELVHTHRTFHFIGDRKDLDAIAVKAFGAGLDKLNW